ncbi:PiggyBac transposable element derived 4, partial [Caligus rogercresseyi]
MLYDPTSSLVPDDSPSSPAASLCRSGNTKKSLSIRMEGFGLPYTDSDSDDSEITEEVVDPSPSNGWWEIDPHNMQSPPPAFDFKADPKLNVSLDESSSPLKYFELFIDDFLIHILVEETNAFSRDFQGKEGASYAKNKGNENIHWAPSFNDVVSLPKQEWYWSKRDSLHIPIFSKIMTRDRFRSIMKYWHLCEGPKMGEIVELIRRKCSMVLVPSKSLLVEETMQIFKSRLGWKQYVPMKRSYEGGSSYALIEAHSGYICNFLFYVGKDTPFMEETRSFSKSSRIVLELMRDLFDKGYCLALDTPFSSASLADYLVSRATDVIGNLIPDRKDLPPDLERRKLLKDDVIAYQRGKLMALKWQGKRALSALSTIHNVSMQTMKFKRGKDCYKPILLFDINQ